MASTRISGWLSAALRSATLTDHPLTNDQRAMDCNLGSVETLAITTSAFRDALGLGFDRAGIAEVVQGVDRTMFYKSTTTIRDHRVWQNVYHMPARDLTLYVKFQADVVTEFTVMTFKEK
jgi:motility quorum-sensing regulator/GCU-specific mRNA interferase toxin